METFAVRTIGVALAVVTLAFAFSLGLRLHDCYVTDLQKNPPPAA